MASIFETLNKINVNEHTEKKNGLTYLSWAWAWAKVKEFYPLAQYKVYETDTGCIYWTDGKTCWVKTGVEIDGLEYIEYLPVMDYKNQSISADKVTSFDVNKTIQRSLTKCLARFGLGLYIYAGEDLPDGEDEPKKTEQKVEKAQVVKCDDCGKDVPRDIAVATYKATGRKLCAACYQEWKKTNEAKTKAEIE